MRNLTAALLSFPLAAGLVSCASAARSGPGSNRQLDTLSRWMQGTFTSEAQATSDPDHYVNVRLVMARIWPERSDGHWLYIEQALADAPDRPYRQRVYRLTSKGDGFQSTVYTLPGDPLSFAGAWRDPSKFDDLSPQMLARRDGCEIDLVWDAGSASFVGSTNGRSCPSDHNGATYATGEVVISEHQMTSWDRGFDAAGNQVWGARMGGYQFIKVSN